jgi:hypothetical protein
VWAEIHLPCHHGKSSTQGVGGGKGLDKRLSNSVNDGNASERTVCSRELTISTPCDGGKYSVQDDVESEKYSMPRNLRIYS